MLEAGFKSAPLLEGVTCEVEDAGPALEVSDCALLLGLLTAVWLEVELILPSGLKVRDTLVADWVRGLQMISRIFVPSRPALSRASTSTTFSRQKRSPSKSAVAMDRPSQAV